MTRRRRKIHKTTPQIQPDFQAGPMTIVRQAYGGRGVGYVNGQTVFVPRTAAGDVVDIRVVKQRRHYAFGEVTTLRRPSLWRVTPPCPLYNRCGGCHLQHLGYARQLAVKTALVRDSLTRIAGLHEVAVLPIIGSAQPFSYRNKVIYHYDRDRGALGLVDRQGQRILDVPQCLISTPRANHIIARIRELASVRPELRRYLHQVQIQTGQRTGECLVTVIVRQDPGVQVHQQLWNAVRDQASGLWLHIKTEDTPAVFHGIMIHIAGVETIHERIGAHRFRLQPRAFFQVNTVQMERLYELVRDAAALQGDEIVLDLYSGGGTIAMTLAPSCARVYAVEVYRQATLLAIQQAMDAGIDNCVFRSGKVERILKRYLAEGLCPDLAVLDPPRAGCRPEALEALARLRVPRLVYVSCSPPTLARDLRRLQDLGYRTTAVQPLDMFPQTYHIECVATLGRTV